MPVAYADHLLPLNATQLERVLSSAGKRVQDIPVPIDRLKRPQQVPAAFLPHLAYEFSVDIWDRAWPEAQKRAVTDAAIRLHQRKGTAYVLREYIRYAGGEVVSIVKPPVRVFSGPSITPQAREAWLAGLPQVRTWLVQEHGAAARLKTFSGARARSRYVNVGAGTINAGAPAPQFRKFTTASTALSRRRRRARWVVSGVETAITVTDFGPWFRLLLPSPRGRRMCWSPGWAESVVTPPRRWVGPVSAG